MRELLAPTTTVPKSRLVELAEAELLEAGLGSALAAEAGEPCTAEQPDIRPKEQARRTMDIQGACGAFTGDLDTWPHSGAAGEFAALHASVGEGGGAAKFSLLWAQELE